MDLAKAYLQEITGKNNDPEGEEIPVQFNPTSMKVTLRNQMEGNQSRGRQRQQYIGSSSAQLALQLVFDTADEGESDAPVSVRDRTDQVARFLVPKPSGKKKVPPRVRFQWGDFIFDGIINQLTEDFDLFAGDGTPLRAKVDITIEEQNSDYQFLANGPGASDPGDAGRPEDPPGGGPGRSAVGPTNRTAPALAGESAAAFATRMGLNPSIWRVIALQAADPLALPAGQPIDFDDAASAGPGVGSRPAVQADRPPDGKGLAALGGLGPTLARIAATTQTQAANQTRAAFGAPAAPTPATASAVSRSTGAAGPARPPGGASGASGAQPPPAPLPDVRGFGGGVPLRDRISTAAAERTSTLGGRVPLQSGTASTREPPATRDPTVPGWVALAEGRRGRTAAADRHPGGCGCGCAGRGTRK